jgi:hypothetical protein
VAVILKEKYFPESDFLQARLGNNPPYAWRNIIQARQVLEKGLMWRVGNGASIRIKGDKWLQTLPTHQFQSPCCGLELDARVSALIDPNTGWWNYELIKANFNEEEAAHICGLALSPLQQADWLV